MQIPRMPSSRPTRAAFKPPALPERGAVELPRRRARGRPRDPEHDCDRDREAGVQELVRGRIPRRHDCEPASWRPRADRRPRTTLRARFASRLLVRASVRCRRDRAADHAGDRDQGQHVGQRLEQHGSRVRVLRQTLCERTREAEQEARRRRAPNGRQFPKITAASAMNPRPAVMFSLNELTNPIERNAPPAAASIPERTTAP